MSNEGHNTTEPQDPQGLGLSRAMDAFGDDPGFEMDALFDQLDADMEQESRLESAQSMSPARRGALIAVVAVVVLGATLGSRFASGKVVANPEFRVWLTSAALLVVSGLGLAAALRPLHKPELSAPLRWGLLLGALALPLGVALFPPEGTFAGVVPHDHSAPFAYTAFKCFATALISASPVVVAWRLLQRGKRPLVWSTAWAAGSAALVGLLSLDMHCAVVDTPHLLFGHFGAFMVALLALVGVALMRSRAASKAVTTSA